MLPVADAALDLLILELLLQTVLVDAPLHLLVALAQLLAAAAVLAILGVPLPGDAGPEDDVLADAGGVERRPRGVALFQPELGPPPAFGDARVDGFAHDGGADAAGRLDLFAGIVEGVGDDGFGAVFVGRDGLRRESGGVVEFFVVGPVGAAVGLGPFCQSGNFRQRRNGRQREGEVA